MAVELIYVSIFAVVGCLFFFFFLLFFRKASHYHGDLSHFGTREEEHAEPRSHMSTADVENPVKAHPSRSNNFYFIKKLSRSLTAERSALVMPSMVKEFFFEELEVATSAFASTSIIKQGHSGDIYKGVMEGGQETVVIKRMRMQNSYLTEMDVYGKALNQGFLVPLLGQCLAKEEIFTVYEYMPYGDLANILAKGRAEYINRSNYASQRYPGAKQDEVELADNVNCTVQLIWPLRMRIARQIAEALVYMHHESKPPLSHRNIQGSSILLSKNFEVRLGSLSDVERLENGELPAYDMYCYGKLLLDLVSGLDISGNSRSQQAQAWMANCFHALVATPLPLSCFGHTGSTSWCCKDKSLLLQWIDKNLLLQPLEEHHLVEIIQVAKLAKLCMEPTTLQRSSMKGVLDLLTLSLHGVF